jgi:hypothetical protein
MKIDKSKIKLVDGFKIRNTLDDDFTVLHNFSTNIANFAPKFYIPKEEWWLDHVFKNEIDFFIEVENLTNELLKTMEFEEAREKIKEKVCIAKPISEVKKEELMKDGDYTVYLIDGNEIRKTFDPHFVFGGHDLVYNYIPLNEIWLEKNIDKEEIPYILLHEKIERDLMKQGKSYDVAHEYATIADKEMRRNKMGGSYPGDANYPWSELNNEEIIQKYYVS